MTGFEYIRSRGAHKHHASGRYDALVESRREIWIGEDYSGVIRESVGPLSFFTDAGRAEWNKAGRPSPKQTPSVLVFAPGCLRGSLARRNQLSRAPEGLSAAMSEYATRLNEIQELLGEGVPDEEVCQAAYNAARGLPGVEEINPLEDQAGRVGRGLVESLGAHRTELIFAYDYSLLGYRKVLVEDQWFGPAGTLYSWCAYLERGWVEALPGPALDRDQ
jgi:hypothetical protein